MITSQYKLVNNLSGWFVFAIALITYWLTLEPTASYWDCGEFIIQGDKLEIGHPPGSPIFMLTARMFVNFAPSPDKAALMVNAMSGLLSALTILLLFWTITHLVRKLVVKDGQRKELSMQQYIVVMGSGLVGALAYCWSDTFWFSAVEAEVYAYSSFCTALVFWLILKWENRADKPHSDRYLIIIAYVIGVSIAVHLLNLLCIPAIVLVFVYRKWPQMKLIGSVVALLVSFVILFFVLYGLMPGFVKVAQVVELIFVNGFGLSFNSGAIAYGILMLLALFWCLAELYMQKSELRIKLSIIVAVTLSGMLFVGSGITIGIVLTVALIALLFWGFNNAGFPVRVMNVAMWSIAVIFIGFSSYAVVLIRSAADTPMNENAPDNVFSLASYLNREQYGEAPLLYGETLFSRPQAVAAEGGVSYEGRKEKGEKIMAKSVHGAEPLNSNNFLSSSQLNANADMARQEGDRYILQDYKAEDIKNPELNMLFPRIYSENHEEYYKQWVEMNTKAPDQIVELTVYNPATGESAYPTPEQKRDMQYKNFRTKAFKPSFKQNLEYFFNYQLNHMYMRYFLWNFVGRQNDINNQGGELDAGNWISGIGFIDNARLGDQSLLPYDQGEGNKGHNTFYFLPLILGLIGLIWQSFSGKRGIQQFWVVFFLFFMTGIAIVLYLNQYPNQPRERDYAFAGSFYAFTIWIGMGVAGLWRLIIFAYRAFTEKQAAAGATSAKGAGSMRFSLRRGADEPMQSPAMTEEPVSMRKTSFVASIVALVLGVCVPLQMVSQTWDDHDRSGRYAALDYARNYLNSLEANAIVFCNGDNDTFPLWYVQEVEGVRPDVRIINLSYLNSDWYANQHRMQAYDAAPAPFTATPQDIAYGELQVAYFWTNDDMEKWRLYNRYVDLAEKYHSTPEEFTEDDKAELEYIFDRFDGEPYIPEAFSNSENLLEALKKIYSRKQLDERGVPVFNAGSLYLPVDKDAVVKAGLIAPEDRDKIVDNISIDLFKGRGYFTLGDLLMLDIIATNAANGWERPIYWASTVGPENHAGLTQYLQSTGMAYQLVPTLNANPATLEKAYENITEKFEWGYRDGEKTPYYDETARRMLSATRNAILENAEAFYYEGHDYNMEGENAKAIDAYNKALNLLNLMETKLPENIGRTDLYSRYRMAQIYGYIADEANLPEAKERAMQILEDEMKYYAPAMKYNKEATRISQEPRLTHAMRTLPVLYYHVALLYEDLGGDPEYPFGLISKSGWNRESLKKVSGVKDGEQEGLTSAEGEYGNGSGSISKEDLDEVRDALFDVAADIVALQQLSPEEYALKPENVLIDDSLFYIYVQQYLLYGGSQEELDKNETFRKVDLERSRRLSEEYTDKTK